MARSSPHSIAAGVAGFAGLSLVVRAVCAGSHGVLRSLGLSLHENEATRVPAMTGVARLSRRREARWFGVAASDRRGARERRRDRRLGVRRLRELASAQSLAQTTLPNAGDERKAYNR
jgi:hypothetical protein